MLRVRVYVFITDIDFRVAALMFMRSSQDRMSGLQEKVFMAGQKLSARVDVFRCEDVICLVGRFVEFLLGICSWVSNLRAYHVGGSGYVFVCGPFYPFLTLPIFLRK